MSALKSLNAALQTTSMQALFTHTGVFQRTSAFISSEVKSAVREIRMVGVVSMSIQVLPFLALKHLNSQVWKSLSTKVRATADVESLVLFSFLPGFNLTKILQ